MANADDSVTDEKILSMPSSADAQSAARRRRDVRTARDKLGEQFEELRAVLPKRSDTELNAKSQILEHSLLVLRELMTRATTLAVELAVVTPEATHRWMQDVSDDGSRPVEHTVMAVMKLFCWSRAWHYAEWWTLDEQSVVDGPDAHIFDPGRDSASDLTAANSEATRPVASGNGTKGPAAADNAQRCVIRDSVSVMRLSRTLINVKGLSSDEGQRDKDLAQFAQVSKNYQFRPRIGMPGRVWSSGLAEWLPGLDDSESYRRSTLAQDFGMKTCLAVPVVLGGQVHSVMAFYATEARSYNSNCHDLATTLAESLASIYSPQSTSYGWDVAMKRMPL